MTEKISRYIYKEEERNMITRFRCGNEMEGNQYWKEEKKIKCRACGERIENIIYMLKECQKTKAEMTIEEFLKEDREGREVRRRILKAREERRWNRKEEGKKRRGKGRERNNKLKRKKEKRTN